METLKSDCVVQDMLKPSESPAGISTVNTWATISFEQNDFTNHPWLCLSLLQTGLHRTSLSLIWRHVSTPWKSCTSWHGRPTPMKKSRRIRARYAAAVRRCSVIPLLVFPVSALLMSSIRPVLALRAVQCILGYSTITLMLSSSSTITKTVCSYCHMFPGRHNCPDQKPLWEGQSDLCLDQSVLGHHMVGGPRARSGWVVRVPGAVTDSHRKDTEQSIPNSFPALHIEDRPRQKNSSPYIISSIGVHTFCVHCNSHRLTLGLRYSFVRPSG